MSKTYPHKLPLDAPREFNVTAGTVITPGDFTWWNGTTLKSVGGATGLVGAWSSEATARRDATARFAGIADFEALSTDKFDRTFAVKPCTIADLACTSFTPKVGDLVGFEKDAAGNYLYGQKVQKVLHPYDAIGYAVRDYSSAVTTVRCAVLSGYALHQQIRSLVKRFGVHVDATGYAAATSHLVDYNFNEYVRILAAEFVVMTLTAGAATFTLTKGTDDLDDTLTVADAQAVGSVHRQEMVGATNPDRLELEHDDDFDVASDATPTGGAGTLIIEYMSQMLVA